jgi:hypothetical protein
MTGKIHFDLHENQQVTLTIQLCQEQPTVIHSSSHEHIIHDLLVALSEACQCICKNKDLYF